MAELASSQPSWVRWLGDSHFSHFNPVYYGCVIAMPSSRAMAGGNSMAADGSRPLGRPTRPGAPRAQPFVRVAGAAAGCHRIITSHAPEDGCTDCAVCPSHSRWLKWLWPSHLTQDGCDVASSAMRARAEACGVADSQNGPCRVCGVLSSTSIWAPHSSGRVTSMWAQCAPV